MCVGACAYVFVRVRVRETGYSVELDWVYSMFV